MFHRRLKKKYLVLLLVVLFISPKAFSGENVSTDKESFAQEYAHLGMLLEKVKDKQTAIHYKPRIIKELNRIKSSVDQSDFATLTPEEKALFIKKFQNNNLHCGYVTKVVDERNRLLLNKEAKNELGGLLDQLLQ